MKILITGAAGQIGSGLSKLLIENGHDLTLVDNLRNGYLENLKAVSYTHLTLPTNREV